MLSFYNVCVRECDESRYVFSTNPLHQDHKHTFTSYVRTVLVDLKDSGETYERDETAPYKE